MARQAGGAVLQAVRAAAVATSPTDRVLLAKFIEGDEAAFAALVTRHTGMVLGVCRRALHNAQDAEDACQAVFLILARKAGRERWQLSIANWLYTTARRVAARAARAAARRAKREARVNPAPSESPLDLMTGREAFATLDEELDKLPAIYREPLVLCYLEGLTRDETAARLGVPAATLKSQLERGRKKLGDALTKRGVALGAGLLAVAATSPAGTPPPRLVESILAAASGPAPAAVGELARGVAVSGGFNKAVLGLVVVGVVALGIGFGALCTSAAGRPPGIDTTPVADAVRADAAPAAPAAPAAGDGESVPETFTYSGRVLGPDGKPVARAKLYVAPPRNYFGGPYSSPEYATTGPDGRFAFTVPKARFGDPFMVVAAAANYGPGWLEIAGRTDDLTLRLVEDDVPITGQVVDLEGKPVPGATVRVVQINAAAQEDLGPWLEAAEAKKGKSFDLEKQYLKRYTVAVPLKVTTDADGRFKLTGVGRNRLVVAQLDGPTIASQWLHMLTRPGKTIEVTAYEGRPEYNEPRTVTTYYGSSFRHVAAPTKPIVGVVRDKDTRKPLAGVSIRSYKLATSLTHLGDGQEVVRTTTDAEGRYRLTGMPKGEGNKIKAVPPDDVPYPAVAADVPDSPGLEPVTVDLELKRGVWIEGRITDKVTGKPVKGGVQYLPLWSNPNRRDYPGVYELVFRSGGRVNEDGSYRVVGLPGPGMLAVYGQPNHYLRASQREDEYGGKGLSDEEFPEYLRGSNCAAVTRVSPAKGADSVTRDVTLDPGWTFTATVLGPDGKPLTGTRSFLLVGHWWDYEATRTAEFTAWFNPHERFEIVLQHPEKGLVGVTQPPKENGGSVTVRLEPGATVTGRLVDAGGKPRAGVELELRFRPKRWRSWFDYSPGPIKTDREGRFRIEALLPGQEYRLSDGQGELPLGGGLRWGETKDLGDVAAQPLLKE